MTKNQIILTDRQPQMAFGVQSIDRPKLNNNVAALPKAALTFSMPTEITTIEALKFRTTPTLTYSRSFPITRLSSRPQ